MTGLDSGRVGRPSAELLTGAVLTVVLGVIAFATTGGYDSSVTVSAANTWAEVVLVLLGAGAASAVLLAGAREPRWGAGTVVLFGVLAALTALSILWSVQPDDSWQAANLTLAYLASFAGAAALARLAPGHWRAAVAAIAIVSTAICVYALGAKVFPGTLAAGDTSGRIQEPLGYWNALGAAAVLGLAPCLWCCARRGGSVLVRGLAAAATSVLIAVTVLSYSRTAALVAALVLIGWLAYVPARVRAAAMLALSSAGSVVIVVWALSRPALTTDGQALAARTSAGHTFGLVIIAAVVVVAVLAGAAARAGDRGLVGPRLRRLAERALVAGAVLVPVLAVIALAASSRGLFGEISHAWSSLTSVNGGAGNGASRFGTLGSSRPLYWSEGISVGEHALFKGVGALGYAIARTLYTHSPRVAEHAHSYVIQTFADLGLLGVAVSLALVIGWLRCTARAVDLRRGWRALDPGPHAERAGLVALALAALGFGVLSATDWTWYFPSVTVPALVAAGWLAGRGPLTRPVGRAARRISLLTRPGTAAAVAGLATFALLAAWLVWQPLRASDDAGAAITAAGQGQTGQAFSDARSAVAADPLALQPRFVLSSMYQSIHDLAAARNELTEAVSIQPRNRDSWLQLGLFDLSRGHPRQALPSLQRAVALDPTIPATVDALARARAELTGGG